MTNDVTNKDAGFPAQFGGIPRQRPILETPRFPARISGRFLTLLERGKRFPKEESFEQSGARWSILGALGDDSC